MSLTAARCRETTTTTGTGDVTLGGAATSPPSVAFSAAFADGDLIDYSIMGRANAEFEVGIGMFNSAANSITRLAVEVSSNANALVNFSAGTKDVIASLNGKSVNAMTRSLPPWTYAAAQVNPQAQVTLASLAIVGRTLRAGDLVRLMGTIRQVAGTGTIAPRFQLQLGGTTIMNEIAFGAIADIGFYFELFLQCLTANSQRIWGRITRDNGGAAQFWSGSGTKDITTNLTLALQGRYNGANGTASLVSDFMSAEIVRSV